MRNLYTDLAIESGGLYGNREVPGVRVTTEDKGLVNMLRVTILDEKGEQALGKPRGEYVTLACPALRKRDLDTREQASNSLSEVLLELLPAGEDAVLVVGLGNRDVTPDALGPRTVEKTLVTRHIQEQLPEIHASLKPVCAVAPGVLGVTGIETLEILQGIVQYVKPRAVIAIDSLAARQTMRICTTIQVSDAGIQPGSGVGNHRRALTRETLGVPVIAIGVPMVVYASTIANDALDLMENDTRAFSGEQRERMMHRLLSDELGEMVVTPREVDELLEDCAAVLGSGINLSLHQGISASDLSQLMA